VQLPNWDHRITVNPTCHERVALPTWDYEGLLSPTGNGTGQPTQDCVPTPPYRWLELGLQALLVRWPCRAPSMMLVYSTRHSRVTIHRPGRGTSSGHFFEAGTPHIE
jgi:hypothetical protein